MTSADPYRAAIDARIAAALPMLRRAARRYTACSADVEDLALDTAYEALRTRDQFDPARPLEPWLLGILRHRASRLARRRRGEVRRDPIEVEDVGARGREFDPAVAAVDRESQAIARHAVANLAGKYSRPLELLLFEGLDPATIARRLALPRPTVRVQLHRGLEHLRAALRRVLAPLLALLTWQRARSATWALTPRASGVSARRSAFGRWLALLLAPLLTFGWFQSGGQEIDDGAAHGVAPSQASPVHAAPAPTDATSARTRLPLAATRRDDFRVHVVDAAGIGVPHVGVRAQPARGWHAFAHRVRAVTDSTGVATLRGIDPDHDPRWHEFVVTTDRGPGARIERNMSEQDAPRSCTLRSADDGVEVRGVVRDTAGRGVAAARVWLSDGIDGPWSGNEVTVTDGDGAFALDAIRVGSFLAARAGGFGGSMPVRITAATADTTLTLGQRHDLPALPIRVLRKGDGVPIEGALVTLGRSMEIAAPWLASNMATWRVPPLQARTDVAGLATFDGVATGDLALVVIAANYTAFGTYARFDGGTIAHGVDVHMDPTVALRGRVIDATSGTPVEGAQVVHRGVHPHDEVELRCAADGSFTMESIDAGSPGRLAVRAAGYLDAAIEFGASATDRVVEVRMRQKTLLNGRLVDPRGRPLAGFEVLARHPPIGAGDAGRDVTRSGADGQFVVALADPDRAEFAWRATEAASWQGDRRAVVRMRDRIELVVPDVLLPSATLACALFDANGVELRDAAVFVRDGAGFAPAGRTDAHGSIEIGPLVPGSYDLLVTDIGAHRAPYRIGPIRLLPGERREIDSRDDRPATSMRTGRLQFVFRREDGELAADAVVSLLALDDRAPFGLFGAASATQELPVGEYAMYVTGESFRAIDGIEVRIEPDSTTRIDRTLETATRRTFVLHGGPLATRDAPQKARGRLLRTSDGAHFGEYSLDLQSALPPTIGAFVTVGDYRFELETADGQVSSAGFRIADTRPQLTSRALELVPGDPARQLLRFTLPLAPDGR